MDKNKGRNDLLAAGRKKLQQFRQKKDGKASSSQGKSSRNSGKSEKHESDTSTSTTAKPTASSQVVEREIASHVDSGEGNVDMSPSLESSLAPKVGSANLELSLQNITPEVGDAEVVLVQEVELKLQKLAIAEHDVGVLVHNGGEDCQDIDVEIVRAMPSSTSGFQDSKGKIEHDALDLPDSVHESEGTSVKVDKENLNRVEGEDQLPLQEDIPDMSLIQARGDQVTDVGCALCLFMLLFNI